jgi:hypothetical protein
VGVGGGGNDKLQLCPNVKTKREMNRGLLGMYGIKFYFKEAKPFFFFFFFLILAALESQKFSKLLHI